MKMFLYKDEPYYYKVHIDLINCTLSIYIKNTGLFRKIKKYKRIAGLKDAGRDEVTNTNIYKRLIDEYHKSKSNNLTPEFFLECSPEVKDLYR
jgi:hypothetical protein